MESCWKTILLLHNLCWLKLEYHKRFFILSPNTGPMFSPLRRINFWRDYRRAVENTLTPIGERSYWAKNREFVYSIGERSYLRENLHTDLRDYPPDSSKSQPTRKIFSLTYQAYQLDVGSSLAAIAAVMTRGHWMQAQKGFDLNTSIAFLLG